MPDGRQLVDPVLGFSGQLPVAKFTASEAKTVVKNGVIEIERKGCKFEIYANLIQVLINSIPPLLAAYTSAKGVLTSLSVVGVNANLSTDRNAKINSKEGWAAASLIIFADLGVELKNTLEMDIMPSLQAGASFKARVFIFTGALGADLKLYSKFLLEIMQVDRKDKEGKDVKDWAYFFAFMGLGIKWSVSGSIGIEIQTEKKGEGGLRSSQNVGSLGSKKGNDSPLMGKNNAKDSFMDVEWQEFERRDQEIANLLKRVEALEKQHRNLNHPNATADIGLFRVSWKTGDRNQALKALRQQIKKLEGQKKEYENLQDKSDTTKIWGSGILAHNLNTKELTDVKKRLKIN